MRQLRIILALAAGLLRLELRERSNLFWMVALPIAFIAIFGGMMNGTEARKPALTVEDRDGSFLSQRFCGHLKAQDLDLRIETPGADSGSPGSAPASGGTPVSAAATGAAGSAPSSASPRSDTVSTAEVKDRTLIIPRGFADSLASGRRIRLPYRTPSNADARYDLSAEVHVYQAIARLLATLAQIDTVSGDHVLAVSSPEFQSRYQSVASRPDLIHASVRTAGRGQTVPVGFAGSAQSMLVLMLLMNTCMTGAITLTREKQNRILARVATLPVSRAGILAGKILGLLGISLIQAAVVIVLGSLIFHVSWGPDPLALLVLLVCLGLSAAALGFFLGGLIRTPEQAGAVAWIIPLLLGALGGTWWPLELVPHWLQVVGHISPTAWAMDGMHGLISFGRGASAIVAPCLVLLGYALVLIAGGSRLLRVTE